MTVWYHVWVCVASEIAEEWREWMRATHVPAVMQTGVFRSYDLFSYEGPRVEAQERAFVVRYEAFSQEALHTYFSIHAPALQAEHEKRYRGKFRAERFILSESK